MATEKPLIEQIKLLSELEFSALFEDIAAHIKKQNWEHVAEDCLNTDNFDFGRNELREDITHYKTKSEELEYKINELERDLDDKNEAVLKAIGILTD